MSSSGTLQLVALVRTDISEELIPSIIRVRRLDELGTLAVTSNRSAETQRQILKLFIVDSCIEGVLVVLLRTFVNLTYVLVNFLLFIVIVKLDDV
jgi:hypothetical protein